MRWTSIPMSRKPDEDGYVLLKTLIAVILLTVCFSAVLASLAPSLAAFAREARGIGFELRARNECVREFAREL